MGKVIKIFKKNYIISPVILMALLLAVFWFSNPGVIRANPGIVEFTSDVILDLSGLSTTTYIGTGADCAFLTVSSTDLNIQGLGDSIAFLLKTLGHKVLQMTPSGGTADLTFSSTYVSSGYVSQWEATSSVPVAYVVGVSNANTWYQVKTDGAAIAGSPFNSGASAEVSFSYTGSGVSEVFTIEGITDPTVLTNSATNVATSTAQLNGNLVSLGGASSTDVWFQWGETDSYGNETASSNKDTAGTFSVNLSSLTQGQTYHFRAMAENISGIATGTDKSFAPVISCGEHNVGGWAWTENVGWISFSCQNCDQDGNNYVDSGACGGDNSTTWTRDYGADMATTTGVITGHVWSSNIGWISFNSDDLVGCPDGTCQAIMATTTYEVSGWGKALSASSTENGDWEGWIKFRNP